MGVCINNTIFFSEVNKILGHSQSASTLFYIYTHTAIDEALKIIDEMHSNFPFERRLEKGTSSRTRTPAPPPVQHLNIPTEVHDVHGCIPCVIQPSNIHHLPMTWFENHQHETRIINTHLLIHQTTPVSIISDYQVRWMEAIIKAIHLHSFPLWMLGWPTTKQGLVMIFP